VDRQSGFHGLGLGPQRDATRIEQGRVLPASPMHAATAAAPLPRVRPVRSPVPLRHRLPDRVAHGNRRGFELVLSRTS